MEVMLRTPVVSSNIRSIGYDEIQRILEVEFLTGMIYEYNRVPPEVFSGFMTSASHGTYFSRFIKNVYECRRVK